MSETADVFADDAVPAEPRVPDDPGPPQQPLRPARTRSGAHPDTETDSPSNEAWSDSNHRRSVKRHSNHVFKTTLEPPQRASTYFSGLENF